MKDRKRFMYGKQFRVNKVLAESRLTKMRRKIMVEFF